MVDGLAKHDFLGLLLPAEVGGAEAGFVSYVEVIENLSRFSAAVASIVNNHTIAAYTIQNWGTAEQKKQYLPGMAKGEILGGFAIYEHGPTPGVGPDALVAVKQDVGYVLNGKKAFVRNAGEAGVYVVFATTDPALGAKALTAFLVKADAIGVKVGEKLETMGLKGCPVADITFENVVLPETALLGAVNGWQRSLPRPLRLLPLRKQRRQSASARPPWNMQPLMPSSAFSSASRSQFCRRFRPCWRKWRLTATSRALVCGMQRC